MNIKVVCWNANSLAPKQAELTRLVALTSPDFLFVSEVKSSVLEVEVPGYHPLFNPRNPQSKQSGGVVLFCRCPVAEWSTEFEPADPITKGRLIRVRHENTQLWFVYSPNSGRQLKTLSVRKRWNDLLEVQLKKHRPALIGGDFNVVADHSLDIHSIKGRHNAAGCTEIETASFRRILAHYSDSFRIKFPLDRRFTYWSHIAGSKAKNKGWRLDYILVDPLQAAVSAADIMSEFDTKSDHCPVVCELEVFSSSK